MLVMGLFDGTPLERPVTCERCERALDVCECPRDASGQVLRPQDQQVRVAREKRRKGKAVTVVQGLDPVANDLPALLRELKNLCAAGGSIHENQIEIQGEHRERVVALLQQRGFPAKSAGG